MASELAAAAAEEAAAIAVVAEQAAAAAEDAAAAETADPQLREPREPRFREFDGDDEGYFDWLDVYPHGYVVNVRRKRSPDYVVLHRATCGAISNRKAAPGSYTARAYVKYCGETLADVEAVPLLCGREHGSFTRRCGICKP